MKLHRVHGPCLVASLVTWASIGRAATITVSTTDDVVTVDGKCSPSALGNANANDRGS